MKKQVLSLIAILFICKAFAQQPVGALTIFSEDGDKFFLILNGEKQNNIAQTNLRIEDLPQPYYNAKIVFENGALGEISKNHLMLTDMDGAFMDVTYKIKHDKSGMPKMSSMPFSFTPITQGYVAPSNVYVMHYGVPAAQTTVTQQTTTTTVGNGNTVNAGVNVGGINMNVSISDPYAAGTVQTTTTTTTTSTNTNNNTTVNTPKQTGCNNAYAMLPGDFTSATTTIKNQNFEDGKLSTAKQIATSNCLNTNQIVEICKLFGYEDSKLDFAKFAYTHCVDGNNYFKVNNVFQYSSSSDELNQFLQGQ